MLTRPEDRTAALSLFLEIWEGFLRQPYDGEATSWKAIATAVRAALEAGAYQTATSIVREYVRDMLTTPTASDHGGDVALDRQRVIQRWQAPEADEATIEERARDTIGAVLIPADQYDALLAEYGL